MEPQGSVALHRFEVVHSSDTHTSDTIEKGENDSLPVQRSEHQLATPPRKRDVRGPKGVVADPPALLQLERRCRVDVGDPRSKQRQQEDVRPLVTCPLVQTVSESQASKEKTPDLLLDLILRDSSGGNGPVGLVDRVNLSVIPIVDGLSEPRQEGPCQDHASEGLQKILKGKPRRDSGGVERVKRVIVSRGRSSTHNTPDEGNPCDRLHQLDSDLPQVLCVSCPSDPQDLSDRGVRLLPSDHLSRLLYLLLGRGRCQKGFY
mmetsp:Transcript_3355/g.6935  ORF Transcript_3355/g.6935 Transcript_3355/m.6935 type:complete len:261 (+) Transcript_3355:961-1743(+)